LIRSELGDPNLRRSGDHKRPIALAPGETGQVVIRATWSNPVDMQNLVLNNLVPVGVAHPANTGIAFPAATLTILSLTLPDGVVGQAFSTQVNIFPVALERIPHPSRRAHYQAASRLIGYGNFSGTPLTSESFSFTVQVTDSATTLQRTIAKGLTIRIGAPW